MAAVLPMKPISLHSILAENPSNPTIDFEWEPFQAHIDAFSKALDVYTRNAERHLAASSTDHTAVVRSLQADKTEVERRIQLERVKEGEMLDGLETERLAVADLTSSLQQVQQNLARVREQSAAVEAELNGLKREVKAKKHEKDRQGRALGEMRDRDGVELRQLEETLGWSVEGVKPNVLLMRFTLIDPSEPEREFSVVIDVSRQEYSVPSCSPAIPNLPEILAQLNADRDIYTFVKRIRKAFRALVPEPQKQPSKFDDLLGPSSRTTAKSNTTSPTVVDETAAMEALKL